MPKQNDINTMSLDEFASSGLLQEVNRRFFHPLGLALYVTKKDGSVVGIGGIIDGRDDPVGMVFPDFETDHLLRYQNVQTELERRIAIRQARLGFSIQPIPGMDEEEAPVQTKDEAVSISIE